MSIVRVSNSLSWSKTFTFNTTSFSIHTALTAILYFLTSPLFQSVVKKQHAPDVSPYLIFLYLSWSQVCAILLFNLSIFFYFFWCVFCCYYRMHWLPAFIFGAVITILSYIVMSFSKEDDQYVFYLSDAYLNLSIKLFIATILFYKSNTFFTVLLGAIIGNLIATAVFVAYHKS